MLFIQALNECTKYNPSLCLLVCRKARAKTWLQQAHALWKTDLGTFALEVVDDGEEEQKQRSLLLSSDPKSHKGQCSV